MSSHHGPGSYLAWPHSVAVLVGVTCSTHRRLSLFSPFLVGLHLRGTLQTKAQSSKRSHFVTMLHFALNDAKSLAAGKRCRICREASVFTARSSGISTWTFRQPKRPSSHRELHILVQAAAAAETAAPDRTESTERLRLNNLAPQPGSRRRNLRKGRGYGAGQGGSCGFGMRGQNSRSGSGTKPGFEGGQMPLYRRVPKLRGIAGGMSAGIPKFVTVNLQQLSAFKENEEVSLETLQQKRILNLSGRDSHLPLKILGTGELTVPLTCKAVSFSGSAKEKIEQAGGTAVEIPGRIKWTRAIGRQRAAAKAQDSQSAQSK